MSFAPVQPDSIYIAFPGPVDVLDHDDQVIVLQEAIRCGPAVLCGRHRCGEGQITAVVPAHPFLTPMPEEDTMTLFTAEAPDQVTA